MAGPNTIETGYAPIKAWIDGVPVEDAARRQLFNIAALPFIHRHVGGDARRAFRQRCHRRLGDRHAEAQSYRPPSASTSAAA